MRGRILVGRFCLCSSIINLLTIHFVRNVRWGKWEYKFRSMGRKYKRLVIECCLHSCICSFDFFFSGLGRYFCSNSFLSCFFTCL